MNMTATTRQIFTKQFVTTTLVGKPAQKNKNRAKTGKR